MQVIRLVTIHPALVHVTMGTLPVILIAYTMAHRHRSDRWTFVGDTTLAISAITTLLAVAFGIVSFVRIDWVGSSGLWRWVHMFVGVAASLLISIFGVVRLRRRARRPVSGRGAVLASVAVVAVTSVAGWIGGEILVFRGGAGVIAAGGGVLAPATSSTPRASHDLVDSMDSIREHWAAITTETARMIAVAPRPDAFERVAADADQLAVLGGELATRFDAPPPESFAADLHRLAAAARARDLAAVSAELGKATASCAHCHDDMR